MYREPHYVRIGTCGNPSDFPQCYNPQPGANVTATGQGIKAHAHGTWVPETEAERNAIREQLERILGSALFRNSKRYPALLRFVVERSLHGLHEPLKERTLGIEVFGREPDYDTNLDPVVRTSAVEIRKRIAQYYDDPSRAAEIRIDFPSGSYAPEFRMPDTPPVTQAPEVVTPQREPSASVSWVRPAVGALLVILLAGLGWAWSRAGSASAVDVFWGPFLSSQDPVSIYLGGYAGDKPGDPVSLTDLHMSERVGFADATALARVASLLAGHNKNYRIRLQRTASLEDLKDGPAVLIGGFNNSWTIRLTGTLRYTFLHDNDTNLSWIQDRNDPSNRTWSHSMGSPFSDVKQDYAIISRVIDPTTGRVVITASGLAKFGTEAAGEFLTNPAVLSEGLKGAPADWSRKNLQMIVATVPVGRRAGPPRVIASYIW